MTQHEIRLRFPGHVIVTEQTMRRFTAPLEVTASNRGGRSMSCRSTVNTSTVATKGYSLTNQATNQMTVLSAWTWKMFPRKVQTVQQLVAVGRKSCVYHNQPS